MKLGIVYAGQGSQKVGMGQDFYNTYPEYASTIDKADMVARSITDFSLKECSFAGPIEILSQTKYTQPCMVAYGIGVTNLLIANKIIPEYTLGLSLGEYCALYASGVFSEEDVIELVTYRGKVMEEAVCGRAVMMAAVLGAEKKLVEESCKKASNQLNGNEYNVVEPANYNCPGQIVISGDTKAVELASEILKENGVRKIIPLSVSGPFHTSLMKPAGDLLREKMKEITFHNQKSNVIFNATAKPCSSDDMIPQLLEKQIQTSVQLEDSIRYMIDAGVDTIVEIGPGSAISKFVKKTCNGIDVYSIDSVEDFEKFVRVYGENKCS